MIFFAGKAGWEEVAGGVCLSNVEVCFTEAGIEPTIITENNIPQCTEEGLPLNGCLSAPPYSIGYFKIPIQAGIEELKTISDRMDYKLVLYPNPASSFISIKVISGENQSIDSNFKVCIFSLDGTAVLNATCTQNGKVDVSKLPSGYYQIAVTDDNNYRYYEKFIKIK